MSIEIKVPVLPESVSDATVAAWHKQAGEAVSRDENLVDLETDKVVLEVPAPADGVLESISKDVGDVVTASDILGILAEGAAAPAPEPQEAAPQAEEAAPATAEAASLSPAAAKIARENNVDASRIEGSGRDGRIIKEDVLDEVENRAQPSAPAAAAPAPAGPRPEERVPVSRLRGRIAERMLEAQHNQALLTSFNEVNLAAVKALRSKHKEAFEETHGVRLGFMSFFVKAAAEALKKLPIINATMDGDEIIYHGYQDIGIAVSSPRGLVVPILRDAGQMGLGEIETQIRDLAVKAREGGLSMDDLQGGTFSITNGGVFGSLLSTPIVNPPQSAILGMHTIKERPVVEDGEIVARPMMYIALTYDHRLIDGRDAVLFLVAIKDALEDPTRLLLEI